MLKRVLSVLITTVFVTSLINVKADANTTDVPKNVISNLEKILNSSDKPIGFDESTTLGEALKNGNISNLVAHRGKERNISTFSDGNETLRTGNVNNVVVNVRFKNEDEFLTKENKGQPMRDIFNNLYNDANISLNSYYKEVSEGKLDLDTSFVGMDTNNSESIELSHERGYYRPYTKKNTIGYFEYVVVNSSTGKFICNMYNRSDNDTVIDTDPSDGVVTQDYLTTVPDVVSIESQMQRYSREMELLAEISNKANQSGITNLNVDKNNDGMLDALTIMVGLADSKNLSDELAWSELLWPHQNSIYYGITPEEIELINYIYNVDLSFLASQEFKLANSNIEKYNLYTSDFIVYDNITVNSDKGNIGFVGVVCHEMAHVLNLPDFYNYTDQQDACVGMWDLMAGTGAVPQYINTYLRKEAGWLTSNQLPAIQSDGEYELKPVSSSDSNDITGYTITLPQYPDQLFFVEYRKSEGLFDGGQVINNYTNEAYKTIRDNEAGLVIYRVDTRVNNINNMLMPGNFEGSPYNLYVFRPETSYSYVYERDAALNGTDRVAYGNIDGSVLKNALTFQDGDNLINSRVLINNVTVDTNTNKIKFTVDAKDPSIIKSEIINDKIIVEFDENIGDESNLSLIQLKQNGVSQSIKTVKSSENNKLEISLVNGTISGDYTLNIPKEAIKDAAGKTLLNDYSTNLSKAPIINTTGVTLNKTTVELKVDETTELTATVMPENATNKNIKWTSSDESIAKVDANGKVTAIKEGAAEITVTTIDGNYTAKCKITVTKKVVNPVDPSTPTTDNNSTTTNNSSSNNKLPYTGKESSMLQVGIIALILGMALTFRFRFKAKANN